MDANPHDLFRENRSGRRHAVCGLCRVIERSAAVLPVLGAGREPGFSLRPAVFGSRRQTNAGAGGEEAGAFATLGLEGHSVFICNSRWREMLFFNKDYGVGGVAQYPATAHVFLRGARVNENRLISPSGNPVMGDRTLHYCVAHEVTHQLTGRALGPLHFYICRNGSVKVMPTTLARATRSITTRPERAFLTSRPEMNFRKSGLYGRFHLQGAYLLDHQHWSVQRFLEDPPPQAREEAEVRERVAGASSRRLSNPPQDTILPHIEWGDLNAFKINLDCGPAEPIL